MSLTGRTLGHYRIGEEISRGGMGIVYRATDVRLNRAVALKVLPEDLTNDPDRRSRFVQEAQAASAVEHPHIAVIHDVGETDGVTYMAMELIDGEKLSTLLSRQRLSAARALELATEAASGLARAHEKGVVHRDLKPANLMVTDQGFAKVIDFGIAKLIEEAAAARLETRTLHDTAPGLVVGTMMYMSPEQARGDKVDYRSDIFSFGVVLYEMLAGRPPFEGRSGMDTASAILHQPAPPLPALGPAVPPDAAAEIQRLVEKCLAKDPRDRYQGMRDVVVDLKAARRRLESATHAAPIFRTRTARRWWLPAAAALAVVAATALSWLWTRGTGTSPPALSENTRPSVAVLYFDNTTGDQELDWLRTGITEMMVTDLSQSPHLEVVGTDRLYGVLAELKRADDRVLSPEVVTQVVERMGVDHVLVGNYMTAGNAIRINVRLQDARTGRIIASDRVEGAGTASLFGIVDDLARRVRANFDRLRSDAAGATALLTPPGVTPAEGLDRGLGDVTTSSIEAYRLYAEGINLHERYREAEAAAQFEKAIAIDPTFAMAYAKLAVVHNNLGRQDLRDKYAELALEHADRLTPRERYYIEGFHYSNRPATVERSVEAYHKCIELDPGHQACRHNLALQLMMFGHLQEAAGHYEELVRRGTTNPTSYSNLAGCYIGMGDAARAIATVEAYSTRNPENGAGHGNVADVLIAAGRYDEALPRLARAELLDATDPGTAAARATAQLLRDDWAAAKEIADRFYRSDDPARRFDGALFHSVAAGYEGRCAPAMEWTQRAIDAFETPGNQTAIARRRMAHLAFACRGQAEGVAAAERAAKDAAGRQQDRITRVELAVAYAMAGRLRDAEEQVRTLQVPTIALRASVDVREVAYARGQLALARRDYTTAVAELQRSAATLPVRLPNILVPGGGPHVPTWYALGEALLGAGRSSEAAAQFERIVTGGHDRVRHPELYVRSFYQLGRLYEASGDTAKALDAYRRFVGYWRNGDMDRERVAEAEHKLTTLR